MTSFATALTKQHTLTVKWCVATCFVEFSGPFEEAWQRCLQDHDEVLQLLRHSHQQVLVHQVVLGLFQGPSTARIPTQRITKKTEINQFVFCPDAV